MPSLWTELSTLGGQTSDDRTGFVGGAFNSDMGSGGANDDWLLPDKLETEKVQLHLNQMNHKTEALFTKVLP